MIITVLLTSEEKELLKNALEHEKDYYNQGWDDGEHPQKLLLYKLLAKLGD